MIDYTKLSFQKQILDHAKNNFWNIVCKYKINRIIEYFTLIIAAAMFFFSFISVKNYLGVKITPDSDSSSLKTYI